MIENRKIKIVIIFFLYLSTILISCTSNHSEIEFPLKDEDIEDILVQEDIDWKIVESESDNEDQIVHSFDNKDKKRICNISSLGSEKMKFLQLVFFPDNPMIHNEYSEEISKDKWKDMLKLAGALYGENIDYNRSYKKMDKYLSNRNSSKYGEALFTERIADIHIMISFVPSKEIYNDYSLRQIWIMDSYAYEETIRGGLVNAWNQKMKNEAIEVVESVSISEIVNVEDDFPTKGLIISGYLKDTYEIRNDEISDIDISNIISTLYIEDYFGATLVDETGERNVIVRMSSLSEDEMKEWRNHYITYSVNEDICIINLSVSEAGITK